MANLKCQTRDAPKGVCRPCSDPEMVPGRFVNSASIYSGGTLTSTLSDPLA